MRTRLKLAVVGFMAAGLLACGSDDGTGPGDQGFGKDEGEIRFSYSGSKLKGDFRARGAYDVDAKGNPKIQPFAFAAQPTGSANGVPFDVTNIYGLDIRLPTIGIVSGGWFSHKTGRFSVADECLAGSTALNCAGLLFMIGIDLMQWTASDTAPPTYFLTAGAVEVASISNGRIRGTFQGTARLLANPDSSLNFVPGADLAVTNGTFNLPIRDDVNFGISLNRIGEPRTLHSWWLPAASLRAH
jgi:hypothetical protein